MAWFNNNDNRNGLQKEIESILNEMSDQHKDSEEYGKMAQNLEMVERAKSYEKDNSIDWTQVAVAGVTVLLPVALILGYEKMNVLTTKATQFIPKVIH